MMFSCFIKGIYGFSENEILPDVPPERFLIAPFCLHVDLNLKPCARTQKQFQLPVRASRVMRA